MPGAPPESTHRRVEKAPSEYGYIPTGEIVRARHDPAGAGVEIER